MHAGSSPHRVECDSGNNEWSRRGADNGGAQLIRDRWRQRLRWDQTRMTQAVDLADAVIAAWNTNNRVTVFLFENLPSELWPTTVPGTSRRTVRMIAGHIHNSRCMRIKMLGRRHGIRAPKSVIRYTVTRRELLPALERSSHGILELLELGISQGGRIPAWGVPWLNLPVDVVHVLAYLVAHEGRHRGQIVLLARQTGHRLPSEITGGLWQWSKRAKEAQAHRG